jgi:hypothetical protein
MPLVDTSPASDWRIRRPRFHGWSPSSVALVLAILGDAAAAILLVWALLDAPNGPAAVLTGDSLLRLVLLRVAAILALAIFATVLLLADRRAAGVLLLGTAIGSALSVPSPYWAVPAVFLGVAGAVALLGSRFVPIAVAGVLSLGASIGVNTITGQWPALYRHLTGQDQAYVQLGDSKIPVPTEEPAYALTPVPGGARMDFSPSSIQLGVGEKATVVLSANADVPVESVAFDLGFDQKVIAVDSVAAGPAYQQWSAQHSVGVISLPGVPDPDPRRGSSNAGVGLDAVTADKVGPTAGDFAVITIVGVQPGQTSLSIPRIRVYSVVDGRILHLADPQPPPGGVQISVT